MIRKLLIIVMGIFLVIAAGSCNIYPLYLKQMKDKFGYSIKQVNLYGSFINIGLWVAFTMGFLYDKYGPRVSCIIGAVLLSGSYAVLHVIMNSELISFSIVPMLILGFIMGQGSALCYTTAVTTNLKNFQIESSSIVGLLVSNMAISPSIFTTYKEALPNVKIANYFLMISVFLAIIILLCSIVYKNIQGEVEDKNEREYNRYKEKKVIYLLILLNILTLAIYTFGVIFNNLKDEVRFPNVIVYPSLQLLNFLFVLFERYGLFDNIYFKEFIAKKLRKEIGKEFNSLSVINPPIKVIINENNTNINVNNVIELKLNEEGLKDEVKSDKRNSSFANVRYSNIVVEKEIDDRKINLSVNNQPEVKSIFQFNSGEEKPKHEYMHTAKNTKIESLNKEEPNNNNNNNNNTPIDNSHQDSASMQDNQLNPDPNSSILVNSNSELQTLVNIFLNKEILILFCILILGIGSVIGNLNNIEFILSAIKIAPTSKEVFEYAILYFVFNSFFRIISGVVLDNLIKAKKFFHFLVIISSVGLLSQILGIFMDQDVLFISVALAGATHGGYMTFAPIYTRTVFGLNNMGKILGFLTTGCAIGSILISGIVFTIFYDVYEADNTCLGKRCFRGAFIISSLFFVVNIILSVWLMKISNRKNALNK